MVKSNGFHMRIFNVIVRGIASNFGYCISWQLYNDELSSLEG